MAEEREWEGTLDSDDHVLFESPNAVLLRRKDIAWIPKRADLLVLTNKRLFTVEHGAVQDEVDLFSGGSAVRVSSPRQHVFRPTSPRMAYAIAYLELAVLLAIILTPEGGLGTVIAGAVLLIVLAALLLPRRQAWKGIQLGKRNSLRIPVWTHEIMLEEQDRVEELAKLLRPIHGTMPGD